MMVDFSKLFETEDDAALKNYAARLPVTEVTIDPETGFPYKRIVVPELKLPVQGQHEYIPGSGAVNPTPLTWFPSVQQGIENVEAISKDGFDSPRNIKNKLFGTEGVERFQMWPEKMVRSGASLPTDVMTGAVQTGVGLRKGDYSDDPYAPQPLSHLIERTQDLSGLAAGGSIAATGIKAEAPGAISRGAKALKDRLQEVFAEDAKAGTAIGAVRNVANRETMPEILARQRASEGYEAAIRDPETKKLYTGMWHEEVLDKMAKDKGILKDQLPTNIVKGYIDNNGRFLTEAQLEKRSQSKSAMFRSDDEAGTALAALNNTLGTDKFSFAFDGLKNLSKESLLKISNEFVSKTPESMSKNKILERIQERHDKLVKFQGELKRGVGSRSAFSDDIVGTGIAGAINSTAPRFYSHVENIINNATTMVRNAEGKRVEVPQQKFNANEVLPYLKNKGATAEEIEALRLPEFLEGKKSITKEELNKHINENKVELEESVLGKPDTSGWSVVREKRNREWGPQGTYETFIVKDKNNKILGNVDEAANEKAAIDQISNQQANPRFAQYQLPGGSNYKETLLSLKNNPVKAKRIEEINNEIQAIDTGNYNNFTEVLNKKSQELFGKDYKSLTNTQKENVKDTFDDVRSSMNEAKNNTDEKRKALVQERLELEHAFTTGHFPAAKNLLVHSRTNDRDIPGVGKTLHAEEIQSDWLQKGNSEGFKLSAKMREKLEPEFNKIDEKIINSGDESVMANPDLKDAIKTAIEKKIITKAEGDLYLRFSAGEGFNAVPDAPFKSGWSDLMIKRLIRQAAEEGKDAISWTPGQAQIDRYPGLQEHFDKVRYNTKTQEFKAYGKNGNVVNKILNQNQLVDYIGKESTDKLINNPSSKDSGVNTLENADLKVGGEFHKKFYDEILLNKVNAIAKKFGGRVEEKEIELRQSPKTRFDKEVVNQPIWLLRLTPEMKKHALEKGFSMFETGLPLVPVDYDPWKKKPRLVPVSHNPWLM